MLRALRRLPPPISTLLPVLASALSAACAGIDAKSPSPADGGQSPGGTPTDGPAAAAEPRASDASITSPPKPCVNLEC
jgi:hypothetical protein